MNESISHYVPAFANRAVCGVPVSGEAHNAQPTCPNCQHLIEQEQEGPPSVRAKWVGVERRRVARN